MDDKTSNKWKWVYPIGLGLILAASLVSRYRNKDSEGEEKKKEDRSIRMHRAMERLDFVTTAKDRKDYE